MWNQILLRLLGQGFATRWETIGHWICDIKLCGLTMRMVEHRAHLISLRMTPLLTGR